MLPPRAHRAGGRGETHSYAAAGEAWGGQPPGRGPQMWGNQGTDSVTHQATSPDPSLQTRGQQTAARGPDPACGQFLYSP